MKVVCDTNVVVSGILFGGPPRQVLILAARGQITNVTSLGLLREAEDVLLRPKCGLRPEQASKVVALFQETSEVAAPSRHVNAITRDPADNLVLETAEAASADFIISGDKHLLDLANWKGIPILSPASFLEEIMGTR